MTCDKDPRPPGSPELFDLKRPSTDQEEALGGPVVLRKVSDHLHHQNILQLHSALHQHLQTVT